MIIPWLIFFLWLSSATATWLIDRITADRSPKYGPTDWVFWSLCMFVWPGILGLMLWAELRHGDLSGR